SPMKGKTLSLTHKARLSRPGELNSMYGVCRKGEDAPMYGKNHSIETKELIRERKCKYNYITPYGVFSTLSEIIPHCNLTRQAISNRITSKAFPEWLKESKHG